MEFSAKYGRCGVAGGLVFPHTSATTNEIQSNQNNEPTERIEYFYRLCACFDNNLNS